MYVTNKAHPSLICICLYINLCFIIVIITRPNSRHHLHFFYRSLQVGDVNVRPEPALPCKDPQLLAQCLIDIASNHPRFVHDCGISF